MFYTQVDFLRMHKRMLSTSDAALSKIDYSMEGTITLPSQIKVYRIVLKHLSLQ